MMSDIEKKSIKLPTPLCSSPEIVDGMTFRSSKQEKEEILNVICRKNKTCSIEECPFKDFVEL